MTEHGHFRTLVKGSAIAFAGNGLIYAMAFVFQLMLVRFLGAESYGVWNFAWTLTLTAAQLSALGLGLSAIYFISGKPEGGPAPSEAAGTALRISVASAVTAALLLPALGRIWIVPAYGFHGLQPLITVLATAIPFISLTNMMECVFRGHQDAAAAFKMKLVPEALKLMVVPAALLVFGADTLTVAVSVAMVMMAPALYGAYMLHRLVLPLGALLRPAADRPSAAPLLSYAMPFFLLEVFQLLRDRADTFIIGYLSTATYLGIYKGAYVFASAILFIPNAVAYLLFPLLNRLISGHGKEDLEIFGARTIRMLFYLGLPAVAAIAIFSRHLLTGLLGPEFLPGERALFLLSLSSGMSLFHVFYGHILASRNRLSLLLAANAAAFALNFSLNIILIPGYGITGAGLASLSGSALLTALLMRFSAVETGGLIFPRRTIGAITIATAALGWAAYFRDRGLTDSAVGFAVFCGAWAAWLWMFERTELRDAVSEARDFLSARLSGAPSRRR